jgi:hypothetical protein
MVSAGLSSFMGASVVEEPGGATGTARVGVEGAGAVEG